MTSAVTSPDTPAFDEALRAQAKAADPARSAWVEANAGSGKTKVLIDRVARLLLRRPDGRPGAHPDSILCVTYTKAAANEMLSRLFSRLGDWSVAEDDALRKRLATLEGRAVTDYTKEDLTQARTLFARALETPGGLRIETIHAFCARILRRFPLEASVSPGFREMEDEEADQLWQAVLSLHLERAAEAKPDAMACLASSTGGLGIGAALEALKPKRQALLAFSRQMTSKGQSLNALIREAAGAGDENAEALVQRAMEDELPISDIKTAISELRHISNSKTDETLRIGLQAVLSETDPFTRYELYLRALAGAKTDWPPKSNPFTKKVPDDGTVIDLFTRKAGEPEGREVTRLKALQQALMAAETAERTEALLTLGLPMIAAYADEKRARALLDFDDLIEATRTLLTHSNTAAWVLYKLDGGLTHLLLDEAQDTSPPQWELINALVAEFQAGLGTERLTEPRTQFVVGDPKQSIYSFQGADQQQFQAERLGFIAREEVIRADINLPEMAMSFRSTPEVLRFVDEVRARVPLDEAATDSLPPLDADLKPHAPRRANQPGRVELWPLEMPLPKTEETSDWTTPTDHVPAEAPRRRLAHHIARTVRDMLDRGETIWSEQSDGSWARKPLAPQDILILVRSRNELFDALINSLKQQEIPVAGADRLRLQNHIGVQDCLNLIRFVLQPADDLTLAEILRGPFCGLVNDNEDLFPLAHGRSKEETLWIRLQAAKSARFAAAHDFLADCLNHRDLPAFDFLSRVLNHRCSDGLSGWDKLVQRLGEPVRDPVKALLMGALSRDMAEAMSLQTYLSDIESTSTVLKRELGEPEGAVRVMTVHGAKGLQAPLVILPDTTSATRTSSDAVFITLEGTPLYSPSARFDCAATRELREAANRAAERESRRLLYVALTRASDRLIIAGAGLGNSKTGYGKSAWYRWCLLAMRALCGEPDDTESPETVLTFGPEPVCLQPISKSGKEGSQDLPTWLKAPVAMPSPPMRLAAPSRLSEDRSAVLAPFGHDRIAALKRGRLIHTLLQTLPNLPGTDRREAAERFLARDLELEPAQRAEMLEVTLTTLTHPDFSDLFAENGRNEAAIVGTLPGGQMVNGRVDRLIIRPNEVLILDYKTDRPAPKSASEVGDAYLVQMAAYRAVMQALYPDGRPVRCALVYTDGPRLIELEGSDMSESLKRMTSRV